MSMKYLLWVITLIGALLGGVVIILVTISSQSAPQEAAGYALACALAVIPYVFTRAAMALQAASRKESTDRIVEALYRLQLEVIKANDNK